MHAVRAVLAAIVPGFGHSELDFGPRLLHAPRKLGQLLAQARSHAPIGGVALLVLEYERTVGTAAESGESRAAAPDGLVCQTHDAHLGVVGHTLADHEHTALAFDERVAVGLVQV